MVRPGVVRLGNGISTIGFQQQGKVEREGYRGSCLLGVRGLEI